MTTDLQTLLIRQKIVTVEQVRDSIDATLGTEATWLEHLLMLHEVDEDTVARCASDALGVPAGDLARLARIPTEVLAQMPRDLAMEHRMVPLWVEADGDLRVGMSDPSNVAGVQEVEFFLGRRILREVVPVTAMAWALSTYYGARGMAGPLLAPGDAVPRPSRLARGSASVPIPVVRVESAEQQ